MSWKKVIKWDGADIGDREAVAAQSENWHESLAVGVQDLIDDLQKGISPTEYMGQESSDGIPKITAGRLEAIFKKHDIKFDVLDWAE